MKSNLFIALEGIDGSGKSTQVRLLAQKLSAAGHKVHTTFEPTDRPIGKLLRDILRGNIKADNKAIAGLFLADRLDHLLNEDDGLVKKIADGFTVISDRYYFSSYAYHAVHMDMGWVIDCNSMCADLLRPDLNIFIDVAPEESMRRITANREVPELYETLDNLKSVRANYLEAFERLTDIELVRTVDGNDTIDVIAENNWAIVQEYLQ
ncbi:MAG: dTMP kinase [Bacteroidota bacterium]